MVRYRPLCVYNSNLKVGGPNAEGAPYRRHIKEGGKSSPLHMFGRGCPPRSTPIAKILILTICLHAYFFKNNLQSVRPLLMPRLTPGQGRGW